MSRSVDEPYKYSNLVVVVVVVRSRYVSLWQKRIEDAWNEKKGVGWGGSSSSSIVVVV